MKVTDLRYGVKAGSTLLPKKDYDYVFLAASCLGSLLSA